MFLIISLVFAAVFAVAGLLLIATSGSKSSKQIHAALATALRSPGFGGNEEIVDIRKNDALSAIPWLHKLLERMNLALELRRFLNQADQKTTSGQFILISIAIWISSGLLINLRVASPGASALLGLLCAMAPAVYIQMKRRRRMMSIQEKLPETLDLMVSALRAGYSMGGALGAAAREAPEPIGREFRLCFEEQNFGIDLRSATQNLLERVPLPDLRIVTTAMLIHKESGGNLAEVLEKTGTVIRERFRLQQQIRVHTAQGRLTGGVLIALPAILALVIYLESPQYVSLLFTRSVGHKLIAGAAVMNAIGLMLIRRIINIRI